MALTPISNSVEFVQDSVPTTAADGDSWLDTSLSPPRLKVFDDAVGAFVEPRSIQNLDAPVSGAGATQTDIEAGAEAAIEEDIVNLSPASNSVAGQLDGGVAAVNWSSKIPQGKSGNNISIPSDTLTTMLSVTGSGYLFFARLKLNTDTGTTSGQIKIDGTVVDARLHEPTVDGGNSGGGNAISYNGNRSDDTASEFYGPYRFDSGFKLEFDNFGGGDFAGAFEVDYVLD